MTNTTTQTALLQDPGVRQMARLYASLKDWYDNIHQERRGVRACERVTNIRDQGLIPLAQRYFQFISNQNNTEFNGDAEHLLQEWADEHRPNYVEESEEHDWEDWDRSLCRVHLDPEIRIATFAHRTSIEVNNHTINAYDIDRVNDDLEAEFESLWGDWW